MVTSLDFAPSSTYFEERAAMTVHCWIEWKESFFSEGCWKKALESGRSSSHKYRRPEIFSESRKFSQFGARGPTGSHDSGTEVFIGDFLCKILTLSLSVLSLGAGAAPVAAPSKKGFRGGQTEIEPCFESGSVKKHKERSPQAAVDVEGAHCNRLWEMKKENLKRTEKWE